MTRAEALIAHAEATLISYGRATLVMPVVMARADVGMIGSIIPLEEMVPHAGNGVAVTV